MYSKIKILVILSSLVNVATYCYAQSDYRNSHHYALETSTRNYDVVWVANGDTVTVYDNNGNPTLFLDGYYVSCQEVTQDIWEYYMHNNPSNIKGPMLPVTNITRAMADSLCVEISRITGLEWRLPTREEWLFFYHGGIISEGYTYCGSNHPEWVAWYKKNSGGKPHPVEDKVANELGLYDMLGNVAEMVTDGSSTIFIGGCFLDPSPNRNDNHLYTTPPPEACGLRLICTHPIMMEKEQ